MRLPIPPSPEQVLLDLAPLIPALYEATEIAAQVTTHFFRSLAAQDRRRSHEANHTLRPDPDLYPQMFRFFAKREFDRLRVQVDFERTPLRNNGLFLHSHGTRSYDIRILKNDHGLLPAPGSSKSKAAFYQQPLNLIGQDGEALGCNLIILWYLNKRYGLDHLSLVCPKNGTETSAESWWSEPIPHPAATTSSSTPVVSEDINISPKRVPKIGSGETE